jgi:hypothetical protein
MLEKLVVLDFTTGIVTVYPNYIENADCSPPFDYESMTNDEGELILHSNTHWMVTKESIIIK